MTQFSLGSIIFNNGTPDADGIVWHGNVDGWDTSDHRVEEYPRPSQHGGIITANLLAMKQMTLFAHAVPESRDITDVYLARAKINSVTAVFTRFASTVLLLTHVENVDRQMAVLRTSLRTKCIDSLALEIELTLRAEDPLKYAAIESTLATSGVAANAGTATTYPTFTLTSPGTPTLTLGTRTVVALASLPAGTVIDMGRMSVLDGATDYFGAMSPASDYFGFAPGNNSVTSTVAGTWKWRSAWL